MKQIILFLILFFSISCNDKSDSKAEKQSIDLEENDENDVLDRFYIEDKNCIKDYEEDKGLIKNIQQYQLENHTLEVHTFEWNKNYKNCQAHYNYIFDVKNKENKVLNKFYLYGIEEDDVMIEKNSNFIQISFYGSAVGFSQCIFLFYENDDLKIYRTDRIEEYETIVDNYFDLKSKTYKIITDEKVIKEQQLTEYPPS
jgi:hypothetical protein